MYFMKNLLAASTAAMVAEVLTIPIDTAKVRLQVQGMNKNDPNFVPKYNGFLGTMKTISSEEGGLALFNGLGAGLQR
jgi:solute carrier family 25 uncoupling protein 8/9